jgi:cellulose synthase/poly-beta-1,6-N-acetylglucosamine synthase-like glycosyltransferase/phosphoheptose isomerase
MISMNEDNTDSLPGQINRRDRGLRLQTIVLYILVGLGALSIYYYFSWWQFHGNLLFIAYILVLVLAVLYVATQIVGNWILFIAARQPKYYPFTSQTSLSVDVFVTAYHEPYSMIENTLRAACDIRGSHHTWLLDDGSDPSLEALAERLGAGYLTRTDHRNAKAGNINAALPRTKGDVIVIFDVDHVPQLDFLEKSLGYFTDQKLGFVQVMLTFSNESESWVAKAATETSLEFYNPTYLGADEIGGATMMGSNALIRRKALESIGGYQPGLAEDLATSIQLHAAGWKSAYVAEPLAPGQAPPSFTAWFTQQLKWARGVFELLITTYPRVFSKLTWGQRLSYAVRMTKYWIGPAVGIHLIATIFILIFASPTLRLVFHEYLIHLTPLIFCDVLIRFVSLRTWQHSSIPKTSLSRAVILVYASWPIYMMAWFMAILRLPLSFHPTPKRKDKLNPVWLLPQVIALSLLTIGLLFTIFVNKHPPSMLLVFAIFQAGLQLLLLTQWFRSEISFSEDFPGYLSWITGQLHSTRIIRREIDGKLRTYIIDLPSMVDPIPLDRIQRVINQLHLAGVQGRQVFILSDHESNRVSEQMAEDLTHIEYSKWMVYRVSSHPNSSPQINHSTQSRRYSEISIDELSVRIEQKDILLIYSPNGQSPRLTKALESCKRLGTTTIGITGLDRSGIARQVDFNIHLSGESLEQITASMHVIEQLIYRVLQEIASRPIPEKTRPIWVTPGFLVNRNGKNHPSPAQANVVVKREDLITHSHLMRRILQESVVSLNASSGSLVTVDRVGEPIDAFISYEGEVHSYPVDHLLDTLQSGLAGWVVQSRKPALITKTHQDARWISRDWEQGQPARSAISVPLLESGEVSGALTLVRRGGHPFNQGDLDRLEAIAGKSLKTYIVGSIPVHAAVENI